MFFPTQNHQRHCLKAYWEMVHKNEANINLLFMPHKKNEASFPENPLEGFSSYWKRWLFNHCIRSPGTSTWPLLRINTLLKNLTCILIIKIIHTHGRKSKIKYKQKKYHNSEIIIINSLVYSFPYMGHARVCVCVLVHVCVCSCTCVYKILNYCIMAHHISIPEK